MTLQFLPPIDVSLLLVTACERLSDEEYSAVLCDVWYEQGKPGRSTPTYITGKSLHHPYRGFRNGRFRSGLSLAMPPSNPHFVEVEERCDQLLDQYNL
jgi:hypothetical protein